MPNTTNLALPFPDEGASVDVPRDIRALAEAIDSKGMPFAMTAGVATASTGGGPAAALFVTYPVGRFTVQPIVNVTCQSDVNFFGAVTDASLTGCRVWVCHYDAIFVTVNPIYIGWTVVQMRPSSVGGFAAPEANEGATITMTCHVEGCPNNGIPVTLPASEPPDWGITVADTPAICGACFNPIDDRS